MSKSLLEQELDLFLGQQEAWQAEHDRARFGRDAEEAVGLAIFLFGRLVQADERNQLRAFREEVTLEEAEQERVRIEGLFRQMLPAAETLLAAVQYAAGQGYPIEQADEFANVLRAVRGILTPDDEFFAGAAQERLREQALDALRQGDVVELREIDD